MKAILSIISKIFQTDRIQRSYGKKFSTHYICKNADLNLILVEATTNINLFMESWGWGGYAWPGFTVKGKTMFQCHDILYLFFPTILGDRCSAYRMAKTKCAALFIMSTLRKERKVKAMSFPLQLDEFSLNKKEVGISHKDMQREQIPQGR